MFHCPCCGYEGLDCPAYQNLGPPPWPRDVKPPYSVHFGPASYDVCACCGFEFGFDDEPGGDVTPITIDKYLDDWIRRGCAWFTSSSRPDNWNLDEQLAKASIVRRLC